MTINGNSGIIKATHKDNVKGYGEVGLDKQVISNIMTLNNTKHKFQVN